MDLDIFTKCLPKLELHAHLSGCFRESSLNRLRAQDNKEPFKFVLEPVTDYKAETWKSCDSTFKNIADAVNTLPRLRSLLAEVIEDFAHEGAIYVELRIGVKEAPTKEEYLNAMLEEIKLQANRFPNTIVKLLLSIARNSSVPYARENVQLAIKYSRGLEDPVIVGVEVGANPYTGNWKDIVPLLTEAREAGLRVSLHCGENPGNAEEWREMIKWHPDRLGHCAFLPLDQLSLESLRALQIPVELCLTVASRWFAIPYSENVWHSLKNHPIIFCTDNTTLNNTSLSKEYHIAMEHFHLDRDEMIRRTRSSIDYVFASDKCKNELREIFEEKLARLASD